MKNTLFATILSAMLVLSGTAIAFKVVQAENQPAYASSARSAQDGQYQDSGQQQRRGGCGCSSGAGQGSGCGGGGAGGCRGGGPGADTQADPQTINAIKQAVSDYYLERFRDTDFEVEIKDFGCHQEAYVVKGDNKIMSFSVSGNSITEIRQ